MKQDKWITDIHTHSTFSYDGVDELKDMLDAAQKEGVDFYGVSEHFDYDVCKQAQKECPQTIDEEAYFHAARHLQEDYAGVVNVLIGAEFGYTENKTAHADYAKVCQKYRPDFIVNSVHTVKGHDYARGLPYRTDKGEIRPKAEVYGEYFALVKKSKSAATFLYEASEQNPYTTFPHAFAMEISYALGEKGLMQTTKNSRSVCCITAGRRTIFA